MSAPKTTAKRRSSARKTIAKRCSGAPKTTAKRRSSARKTIAKRCSGAPKTTAKRRLSARRVHELRQSLEALLRSRGAQPDLDHDPLGIVRSYSDPADQEVVGLLASTLAFGNVVAIRSKVQEALRRLGPSPAAQLAKTPLWDLQERFTGFVHRIYRGEHVAAMLHHAALVRQRDGDLGRALKIHIAASDGDLREGLARLADELRGPKHDRSMHHLLSDPRSNSACKRWHLYLRWMVRPADGVDLGLWPLPASILRIPLDTHVLRISQNLRLTERRDASWKTVEEVTNALSELDPTDPIRYDFALCHLGVSRSCPRRRDPARCTGCVLHDVCRRVSRPSRDRPVPRNQPPVPDHGRKAPQ